MTDGVEDQAGTAEQGVLRDETVDGVRTIALAHWRAFHELMLRKATLRSGLIWRGQKRPWPLKPRLDRAFPPFDPPAPEEDELGAGTRMQYERDQWGLRYAGQLERFKGAAAGRRGVNPRNLDGVKGQEDQDDEWWALAQHHGLYTPMLDWTDSPFAALFFAFEEDSSSERIEEPYGEHYRCVFALNPFAIELWNADRSRERENYLRMFPVPLPPHNPDDRGASARARAKQQRLEREQLQFPKIRIIRPRTDENLRLLSQGGMFTQAPPGEDLEGFITNLVRKEVRERERGIRGPSLNELPSSILLKILIREDDPRDCLVALNRMGINQRNLFPDLFGACMYVNRFIEDPEY